MLPKAPKTLKKAGVLHQAGVIPYVVEEGELRVLLISSRDTGRWVIPRGRVERAHGGHTGTAQQEAYEEAGIVGEIAELPLGCYTYFKRGTHGESTPAVVRVYPYRVLHQKKKWPEMESRTQRWVSVEEAIRMVDEDGLAALFRRFREVVKE
jgi:8-oxo-dGTP pyrophosphatase MutT (NUDIX family)